MQYRTEVDGLRAIAVVPVILFHAGLELLSGGFLGVDVFFVISGYLITAIIIEDLETKCFSLVKFYERRARRILPALFFVIVCCIPCAWAWMLPSNIKDFSQSLVAVSLFSSNFLFWIESGYFASISEQKPLLHTWSLAVEEQFYLLFPMFLFLIWRFGRSGVFLTVVLVTVISLIICEWCWRNWPTANFYLAPTRAWELLAGSITAFVAQKHGVRKNNFLSLLGLALVLYSFIAFNSSMPFPSIYSLVPVSGVVLLLLYAGKETIAAKMLSTRLLTGIGLISYSAYLWHQPLFAFARLQSLEDPSFFLLMTLSCLSLAFAFFTWKFIEQPFRGNEPFFSQNKILLSLAVSISILFISAGFAGHFTDGFKTKFQSNIEGDVGTDDFFNYIDAKYKDCESVSIRSGALYWRKILRCKQTREGNPDVILLGDSHAEHLYIGLAESMDKKNVAFYIQDGAPYVTNPKFSTIFHELTKGNSVKTVVLTMHYNSRVNNSEELRLGFEETIRTLRSAGNKVVLVGDIPRFKVHPEHIKYGDMTRALKMSKMSVEQANAQREVYHGVLEQLSADLGVKYVDLYPQICGTDSCSMVSGNRLLYRDKHHLNILGSKLLGGYLAQEIGFK